MRRGDNAEEHFSAGPRCITIFNIALGSLRPRLSVGEGLYEKCARPPELIIAT